MGRSELPLDRDSGPVAAFALDLRELRRSAGDRPYRELAKLAGFSPSVLSGATSGQRLPTLQVALAFVDACGADRTEWTRRWHEAASTPNGRTVGNLLRRPAGSGDRVPEPALPRPDQLPAGFGRFCGRRRELARLTALTEPTGGPTTPVLITGPLGVGKSGLAVRWARLNQERYPDGVLYADLAADPSAPHDVLGDFLHAMGAPERLISQGMARRSALYRSMLAGRRMLVVLDNAADETQVRLLLAESATNQIVITSRTRLAGLDGLERIAPDVLSLDQSLDMLGGIVGHKTVAAERRNAVELAELCDHLPLALRVAAVRVSIRRGWTLAHAVAQLRDEKRRLDYLKAGDVDVREFVAAAVDRLGPAARRAFSALGGQRTPHVTAAQLAQQLRTELHVAEDLLETLVDAGLLRPASAAGGYRMLQLFRLQAAQTAAEITWSSTPIELSRSRRQDRDDWYPTAVGRSAAD